MDTGSLRNIYNEINVGIVVVVASTWDLNVSVRHADIFGVDSQIFRGRHDSEFNLTIRAKGFVRPFSDGPNFLNSGNTVVGDQNL